MLSLFFIMLGSGLLLLVLAGFLYVRWDIPDALDEVSGRKRKRQIEKLQKASMSIGATSVVASTTQMFREGEEDAEISHLIQNVQTSQITTSKELPSQDLGATTIISEEVAISDLLSSPLPSTMEVKKSVKIIHEMTSLET